MFFHRGVFITAIFFYEVMDEACRATDVLLIAAVTLHFFVNTNSVLEIGHLSLVHLRFVKVCDRACLRVKDL